MSQPHESNHLFHFGRIADLPASSSRRQRNSSAVFHLPLPKLRKQVTKAAESTRGKVNCWLHTGVELLKIMRIVAESCSRVASSIDSCLVPWVLYEMSPATPTRDMSRGSACAATLSLQGRSNPARKACLYRPISVAIASKKASASIVETRLRVSSPARPPGDGMSSPDRKSTRLN